MLCFILSWNEFLYAFILASFESRTLTVGIPGLVTPHGTLWGQVAAVAVVATLLLVVAGCSLSPVPTTYSAPPPPSAAQAMQHLGSIVELIESGDVSGLCRYGGGNRPP